MRLTIAPIFDEHTWVRDTWGRYARRFAQDGGSVMRMLHEDFVEASLRASDVAVFVARETQHRARVGWIACEPNVVHYVFVERDHRRNYNPPQLLRIGERLVRHAVEHGPLTTDWRPTHLTEAGRCFLRHLAEVGLYCRAKAPPQADHGDRKHVVHS